jgi:hypothetical protein
MRLRTFAAPNAIRDEIRAISGAFPAVFGPLGGLAHDLQL